MEDSATDTDAKPYSHGDNLGLDDAEDDSTLAESGDVSLHSEGSVSDDGTDSDDVIDLAGYSDDGSESTATDGGKQSAESEQVQSTTPVASERKVTKYKLVGDSDPVKVGLGARTEGDANSESSPSSTTVVTPQPPSQQERRSPASDASSDGRRKNSRRNSLVPMNGPASPFFDSAYTDIYTQLSLENAGAAAGTNIGPDGQVTPSIGDRVKSVLGQLADAGDLAMTDEQRKQRSEEIDRAMSKTPLADTLARGRYFQAEFGKKQLCHRCNQPGHFARECPNGQAALTCFNCGMSGHATDSCPTKRCIRCGAVGHTAWRCPQRRRPSSGANQRCSFCGSFQHTTELCHHVSHPAKDLRQVVCFACGELGHSSCGSFPPASKPAVYCCNCGEAGHVSQSCRRQTESVLWRTGQAQNMPKRYLHTQGRARMPRLRDGSSSARQRSTTSKAQTSASKPQKGKKCFACNQSGHLVAECPSRPRSQPSKRKHSNSPVEVPRKRSKLGHHSGEDAEQQKFHARLVKRAAKKAAQKALELASGKPGKASKKPKKKKQKKSSATNTKSSTKTTPSRRRAAREQELKTVRAALLRAKQGSAAHKKHAKRLAVLTGQLSQAQKRSPSKANNNDTARQNRKTGKQKNVPQRNKKSKTEPFRLKHYSKAPSKSGSKPGEKTKKVAKRDALL